MTGALATGLMSLLLAAQAQNGPATRCEEGSADCAAEESQGRVDEEITVYGDKSRPQIRQEFRAIENRMYTLFNNLNEQNDYDIVCRKETRVGSQIIRRVCKARLFFKARSELAEGESTSTLRPSALTNVKRHEAKLREITRELAAENPELLELLRTRQSMLDEYEWLDDEE